ncbi:MAG: arsenite methyltransferase [Chlamydiales bacterium]|jgi:arsenite methyltransferase
MNQILQDVKTYYGKTLETSKDLQTTACLAGAVPKYLRPYVSNIHEEIISKFYGCGSPIPSALKGATVLDLGCGSGRDCYILSQLVGEEGRVIGVDMTLEQLTVARKHLDYHTDKFGYSSPNVEFYESYIEDLQLIEEASIDVVVSNCVINLSANKERVFSEIFRVLKPGGELYFSDIFSSRRISKELMEDPVLLGECLSGALYIEDFRRMLQKVGCQDYRVLASHNVSLKSIEVEGKLGMIDFDSILIRAFKCDFEDRCENYGHVAYYLGSLEGASHEFVLDDEHVFKKGLPVPVCGNTAKMLSETRFKKYFNVLGEFSTHYGSFDCAPQTIRELSAGACC